MRLKVCGMKYQENIIEVAALRPDYMGFIFYEKSPRFFDGEIPQIGVTIKKVGVFVNASIDEIIEKVSKYGLNAIQLHGEESAEYCEELKRHYENPEYSGDEVISTKRLPRFARNDVAIIKAFSIKDTFDFGVLERYEASCDYFLFDTKGKLPGGNGYAFNWNILKNYPSKKPYFLSGGIGLDEVKNVLSFLDSPESEYCYAIDVNSKFEQEPGLKDIEKLKEFINYLSC